MATTPLNTKQPVKIFTFKVTNYHVNGDISEVATTAAQRSIVQNALDRLQDIAPAISGQQVKKVIITIGNGQDTA